MPPVNFYQDWGAPAREYGAMLKNDDERLRHINKHPAAAKEAAGLFSPLFRQNDRRAFVGK
jgi:hypothetical protein